MSGVIPTERYGIDHRHHDPSPHTHRLSTDHDSYSQLEAVPPDSNNKELTPLELNAPPSRTSARRGESPSRLQTVPSQYDSEKEYLRPSETAALVNDEGTGSSVEKHGSRRRRWVICSLLFGVVVVGAILGGTLGTLLHRDSGRPASEGNR